MARKRDYEDGDFDPPKRSSPYQNISDDEYEDDYDDTYDDYDDEEAYTSSSVKKGARKGGGNFGGTAKLLVAVIVLLVVILIALVIVRAVLSKKTTQPDNVQPKASVDTIPEQTTIPAPIVFGPTVDATEEPIQNGDGIHHNDAQHVFIRIVERDDGSAVEIHHGRGRIHFGKTRLHLFGGLGRVKRLIGDDQLIRLVGRRRGKDVARLGLFVGQFGSLPIGGNIELEAIALDQLAVGGQVGQRSLLGSVVHFGHTLGHRGSAEAQGQHGQQHYKHLFHRDYHPFVALSGQIYWGQYSLNSAAAQAFLHERLFFCTNDGFGAQNAAHIDPSFMIYLLQSNCLREEGLLTC